MLPLLSASSSPVLSAGQAELLLWLVVGGVIGAGLLAVWACSPTKRKRLDPTKSLIRSWIAISLVLGLLLFCATAFLIDDSPLRSTLFGGLIASTGSAVAYYFSSRTADQARADILTATSRLAGPAVGTKPTAFAAAHPPDGKINTAYTYHFAANGLPAPVFWLADGSLPPGLQLDTTGLLHGTATAPAAKHTFKVAAGNSAGMLASPDLSLTIS
jgi:hypothetical protein